MAFLFVDLIVLRPPITGCFCVVVHVWISLGSDSGLTFSSLWNFSLHGVFLLNIMVSVSDFFLLVNG